MKAESRRLLTQIIDDHQPKGDTGRCGLCLDEWPCDTWERARTVLRTEATIDKPSPPAWARRVGVAVGVTITVIPIGAVLLVLFKLLAELVRWALG